MFVGMFEERESQKEIWKLLVRDLNEAIYLCMIVNMIFVDSES